MPSAANSRTWSRVHQWTSLVCTAFLLLLCVTGLPLIFHHEIDHLLGEMAEPAVLPADTPPADADRLVAIGQAQRPGEVVQYVVWARDEPHLIVVYTAASVDAPEVSGAVALDARTGQLLGTPKVQEGLIYVLLRLHIDMFAGLAGKLFLGLMGLLFAVAIVSGIVVYGPSMRKLEFGTVRHERVGVVRWLDLHNLIGIVTVLWALTVGLTGVVNAWADLAIKAWQAGQLAEMTASYQDALPPARLASLQTAVMRARDLMPDMVPSFVAYPGSAWSSKSHYAVFMRGDTALTSRLLKPALIDATTGELTDSRDLPWYLSTLLLSQPLHFGDYGGMPLKIIWALLDIATIVVLASGLYLWFARRRTGAQAALGWENGGKQGGRERPAGTAS